MQPIKAADGWQASENTWGGGAGRGTGSSHVIWGRGLNSTGQGGEKLFSRLKKSVNSVSSVVSPKEIKLSEFILVSTKQPGN